MAIEYSNFSQSVLHHDRKNTVMKYSLELMVDGERLSKILHAGDGGVGGLCFLALEVLGYEEGTVEQKNWKETISTDKLRECRLVLVRNEKIYEGVGASGKSVNSILTAFF